MASICRSFPILLFILIQFQCKAQVLSTSDLEVVGTTSSGKIFYAKNMLVNFTNAKDFCERRGVKLASIGNMEEALLSATWAVGQAVQQAVTQLQTGGVDLSNLLSMFQISNCYKDPTNPSAGISTLCQGIGRPLCASSSLPPPINIDGLTLMGSTSMPGVQKGFYIRRNFSTWEESRDFCANRGLSMATITSNEDHEVLRIWAITNSQFTGFWLGGHFQTDSAWKWIEPMEKIPLNGETNGFQAWGVRQPASAGGRVCLAAVVWSTSVMDWYAEPCSNIRYTVCMNKTKE